MKQYVLIAMLSIMSAGHAMNFDIDSQEDFPSLEKARTSKRRQNHRKHKNNQIKEDNFVNEISQSDDHLDEKSPLTLYRDLLTLASQVPQGMKHITIYLPHEINLWNELDFHFCSHCGQKLCDKLYSDYDGHGKPLGQLLEHIDEILKEYANYLISTQQPEWQTKLRLATARGIVIKAVFHHHEEVSNLFQATSAEDTYPKFFSGNPFEAGIKFDHLW